MARHGCLVLHVEVRGGGVHLHAAGFERGATGVGRRIFREGVQRVHAVGRHTQCFIEDAAATNTAGGASRLPRDPEERDPPRRTSRPRGPPRRQARRPEADDAISLGVSVAGEQPPPGSSIAGIGSRAWRSRQTRDVELDAVGLEIGAREGARRLVAEEQARVRATISTTQCEGASAPTARALSRNAGDRARPMREGRERSLTATRSLRPRELKATEGDASVQRRSCLSQAIL